MHANISLPFSVLLSVCEWHFKQTQTPLPSVRERKVDGTHVGSPAAAGGSPGTHTWTSPCGSAPSPSLCTAAADFPYSLPSLLYKHAPCCLQESQCEHPIQEAARLWFENFPSPLNHAKVSSLSSDKVIKSSLSVPVQINTELSMTLIFTACIKDVKHSIRKDLKVFQERCRWQP